MITKPSEYAKSPYPYFGAKSRIAPEVWARFGDVANFVDPFVGSNAILLARPGWDWEAGNWRDEKPRLETVNDADGFIPNLLRAIRADPEGVAKWADERVDEVEVTANHIWLVQRKAELAERMIADRDYYDVEIAGLWLHGIACWIGSGWCSGEGPWTSEGGRVVNTAKRDGVNRKLVHLGGAGQGVNRKRPLITNDGVGVTRNSGGIYDWMDALSARLRRVRVCCGDWSRVCGPTPTVKQGLTGLFMDPPYLGTEREPELYSVDSDTVAEDVRRWAIDHGDDPLLRICVAGYERPGYTFPDSWECVAWKAHGGYGSQGNGTGRENSRRERLWFNRHCLRPDRARQEVLDL